MLHLLLNADLYTPEPQGHRHVLVAADRIAWIGTDRPDFPASLGVETTDLEGRKVIPGLIDGHVHVTGGGGEAGHDTRVAPIAPSHFTRNGVTTAVGLLGTDDVIRTPAELVATTLGLRASGLSAWCYTGGYHLPPATVTGTVRGDLALVECIVGVGELAISDHRSSQPSLGELLRVAADAHVGGLMSGKAGVLHLHVGDGPRGLELVREALAHGEVPAAVYHPTHVNRRRALFDEALELAKAGVTVDVTAFPVGPDEDAWSATDGVLRYLDAGAPPDRLTVSSDAGGCLPSFDDAGRVSSMGVGHPGTMSCTLAGVTSRGVPLEQALPPFTSNVARHLMLERKGRIVAGMDADLVVLDDRMGAHSVMARGRWHVRGGKVVVKGALEGAA